MKTNIVEVEVYPVIVNRYGVGPEVDGYTYIGVLSTGGRIQLRKKSKRKYRFATMFDVAVGPGEGVACHFLYRTKKPTFKACATVVKTFIIREAKNG
jgi:hypothetical protein